MSFGFLAEINCNLINFLSLNKPISIGAAFAYAIAGVEVPVVRPVDGYIGIKYRVFSGRIRAKPGSKEIMDFTVFNNLNEDKLPPDQN